jgi:hypothetical protein
MQPLDIDTLAGALQVRPGGPWPTIRSTRHGRAAQLGIGIAAAALPQRMALLHRLCGAAHSIAAGHAVAAATGAWRGVDAAARRRLQADTLREHLRRLWLELPAVLADGAAAGGHADNAAGRACGLDPGALAACPVARGADHLDEVSRQWVEAQLLGGPAAAWLQAWDEDAADAAARWVQGCRTGPARVLARLHTLLGDRAQPVRALLPHASPGGLQALAADLLADDGFERAPRWQGSCAETGSWTRLADRWSPAPSLWMRHAARVAEVARLVGEQGHRWLDQGALALEPGAGLGWCEMARGLLLYRVRVEEGGRVAECRLVAPTEWNFHPQGSAAHALAALPRDAGASLARALVAAYDPCVRVSLSPETADA